METAINLRPTNTRSSFLPAVVHTHSSLAHDLEPGRKSGGKKHQGRTSDPKRAPATATTKPVGRLCSKTDTATSFCLKLTSLAQPSLSHSVVILDFRAVQLYAPVVFRKAQGGAAIVVARPDEIRTRKSTFKVWLGISGCTTVYSSVVFAFPPKSSRVAFGSEISPHYHHGCRTPVALDTLGIRALVVEVEWPVVWLD